MTKIRILSFLFFLSLIAPLSNAEEYANLPLVVSKPEEVAISTDSTLEVKGTRSLASAWLQLLRQPNENNYGVPEEAILEVWASDPNFARTFDGLNSSNGDLKTIVDSGFSPKTFDWKLVAPKIVQGTWAKSNEVYPVVDEKTGKVIVNGISIIGMSKRDMIDFKNPYVIDKEGLKTKYFPIKSQFTADMLKAAIGTDNITKAINSAGVNVASSDFPVADLENQTYTTGSASFGMPKLQNAKEAGFKLDSRTTQNYDVYLLEFSVTIRELSTEYAEEISFRFDCGNDCVALEMAPIKVVKNDIVEQKIQTPAVKIKGVEVGEMFSRKITFEVLRPQIKAFGRDENRFSWSLTDEAIETGTHVFLAALGVPRNSKKIELTRSVAIKSNEEYFEPSKWASTQPLQTVISLK